MDENKIWQDSFPTSLMVKKKCDKKYNQYLSKVEAIREGIKIVILLLLHYCFGVIYKLFNSKYHE